MNERRRRRQASHERTLDAAAYLMCCDGLAGVGVMGVKAEAGSTPGGFYGHIASMCVQCTAAVFAAGAQCAPWLREACARRTLRLADFIESLFPPGHAPGAGLNVIGALSGAVQVARMVGAAGAAHIRQVCRAMLLATYDEGKAGTAR